MTAVFRYAAKSSHKRYGTFSVPAVRLTLLKLCIIIMQRIIRISMTAAAVTGLRALKNIMLHEKLKTSCPQYRKTAFFFRSGADSELKMIYALIPMSAYSTAHTTGNTPAGGSRGGFLNILKNSSYLPFPVISADSSPAASADPVKNNSLSISDLLIVSHPFSVYYTMSQNRLYLKTN